MANHASKLTCLHTCFNEHNHMGPIDKPEPLENLPLQNSPAPPPPPLSLILLCELFICRKCTWNRAAGENLTFVPHLPNQFQGPENGKKLMKLSFSVIFCIL